MASAKEIAAAAALLGLTLIGQIAIAHPRTEFKTEYWFDEYLTYVIASDPSPQHATMALRAGVDGMPPLYYSVLRTTQWITGGDPQTVYRACSTAAMWIALVAIYATLRSALSVVVSAAAVLVFWSQPLITTYAIEGRPYAMLVAGIALLAWGLRMRGWPSVVMVMLAAAFTCSIHYLGIISVSLALAGELILGPDAIATRLRRIVPGIIGMAALLPILPMMLDIGSIAQRLEQGSHKPLVLGSNPSAPIAEPPPLRAGSRRKWLILAAVILILVFRRTSSPRTSVTALNTVSTDDAYVNGYVTFVAARVPGQIVRVLVDDDYRVKKGDLLVELDKTPYRGSGGDQEGRSGNCRG
jgi:hypothetical protein